MEGGPIAEWEQVTGGVKVGTRVRQLEWPFTEEEEGTEGAAGEAVVC